MLTGLLLVSYCSVWVLTLVIIEMSKEDNLTASTCDSSRQKVKTRTILAFGVIGFLVDFFFAISISASQDILEATEIPTSLVLLAAAGPECSTTVVYPYFLQKIPVLAASWVIFLSFPSLECS